MNCQTVQTQFAVKPQASRGSVNFRGAALRQGYVNKARGLTSRSAALQPAKRNSAVLVEASSEEKPNLFQRVGAGLATLGVASALTLGGVQEAAIAGEFDILNDPVPSAYIIDDAGLLSRATTGALVKELKNLKAQTGFELDVVTIRKLVFETDPFAFADQVLEGWYPTAELGNDKGLLLVVQTSKEGALVGGPNFMSKVGDDLIDSIISDNIPILGGEEKYNEAVLSSVKRIEAILSGSEDPGPPVRQAKQTGSNYKTKEETGASRNKFAGVVIGLLIIATAVPMIQYYGYTSDE
mmetsp:Transcript_39383/g.47753  ORF Transcript_39383/g.47753 Transcript_39383/m.47753 type:complete len:296 (+) Transcript_39383:62-949(+)|eukprot:CAMPEP_0197863362 /NCGR_PEP_ID=MMETSP1438-20131217/40766_1 /TAXON_ID=1461541 /ORGANISM="Pterosperma sp., Strain CCMP1384" /LENGTH=295 /DNA_ID=CAMNT_0043481229 /DNA_START=35 /DNA_END=922 /DNA_ORIENTATION=+